jgi:hypothetical protein
MDLKNLKKTWQQLPSGKELDEGQIREILHRRTGNLLDRIDRNVRIGFVILFVLIILFLFDDFILVPMLIQGMEADVEIPGWLFFMSIFANSLILGTFLYFGIHYYRVKKKCDIACNMRQTLIKIIETLRIYKRLFYLALIIFTLSMIFQFITGYYSGVTWDLQNQGIPLTDVPVKKLLIAIAVGILVLGVSAGGIYLLMRWGFRRLYGKYISKLKQTLQELDEIEN